MKVHGVVHVLDLERLERVRGRIDVTRDEPHRHANATRSVRQPDHGAMLSGERVERGAHFLSARKAKKLMSSQNQADLVLWDLLTKPAVCFALAGSGM
jgi:hypothetical protein